MTSTTVYRKILKIAKPVGVLAFWLGLWQAAALVVGEQLALFLPGPVKVAGRLAVLLGRPDFWLAVGASLARVAVGFSGGVAMGILLGVLCAENRVADALLAPLMRALRAVPVVSFIILVFVFLRVDYIPVFISFLMVMPLLWQAARDGISATDSALLEMSRVYCLSRRKTLFSVRLPSAAGRILSAAVAALGLAWKSGIAAEVISAPTHSLGYQITTAKSDLSYDELFAVTAMVIMLSMLLEHLLSVVSKKTGGRDAK